MCVWGVFPRRVLGGAAAACRSVSTAATLRRSHRCADVQCGHSVSLCGWVDTVRRVSRNTAFVLLRDVSGLVQLLWDNDRLGEQLPSRESVVWVRGVVEKRPAGQENPLLEATGAVEVHVQHWSMLGECAVAPRSLDAEGVPRFLQLRNPTLQSRLKTRSKAASLVRQYLEEQQFLEIELPTLFRSTPEGAREFLVPTRFRGEFYALAQSPQQYKQLLMVGGLDRYYSFARCYRDEGGRIDRQPEFTQIDLEMSFVEARDVQLLVEGLLVRLWTQLLGVPAAEISFPRMTYREAMDRFGSDKPDLRFSPELQPLAKEVLFQEGSALLDGMMKFPVTKGGASSIGPVVALRLPQLGTLLDKKDLRVLEEHARGGDDKNKTGWLLSSQVVDAESGVWKGALEKHFSIEALSLLGQHLGVQDGDLVLLAIARSSDLSTVDRTLEKLGRARSQGAQHLWGRNIMVPSPQDFKFLWVHDFPLFQAADPEDPLLEGRELVCSHHPFTAPHPEDVGRLMSDPLSVRALHYDIVLNGVELGGGSIRNHIPAQQRLVLEDLLKVDSSQFQHLLSALELGCPPHGGIAFGFDRLCAILCGETSIREVIAFPKSSTGRDPLIGAPSPISEAQLREYHLHIR